MVGKGDRRAGEEAAGEAGVAAEGAGEWGGRAGVGQALRDRRGGREVELGMGSSQVGDT